ncbi:hypothetical protein FEM48_Zijuj03G0195200 [Ziziphus jujuba var. spinosa]|uniref:Uncharacterized protein n=1 Tax=Ziziphus jujuba var. spinosa TaxID=714518 RepID=A0A978VS72_ZIZJJ|nr:hypothetical protein FEM48_Zijuj03G0195200 [Ziziphus jujuba var. spinosa]
MSIVHLDLSFNSLDGEIPSFLENLMSIVHLDSSFNSLEGEIPSFLGNLTSIVDLSFSSNSLEGEIPSSLENLASLVYLDLTYNSLEGEITSSLGNLTSQKLWDIVNEGYTIPADITILDDNQKKELNENQQKDSQALFVLQQPVVDEIFPRIMGATTEKEAWDTL